MVDLNKTDGRFHARRWGVVTEQQIADNPLLALGSGSTAIPYEVSLSADGRWLAVSATDEPGTLRVCDTDSTERAGTIRTGAAHARPLALTADGRLLAYLGWGWRAGKGDSHVELGVAENSGTIKAHIELPPDRTIVSACFSADNRLLAAAEARGTPKANLLATQPPWEIVFWEAATLRERRRIRGVELGPRPCLAFSPDGNHLATADLGGTVRILDLETGRLAVPLVWTATRLTGLAYSPDGRRLAVAGLDDHIRLYDALLGHELLQLRCLGQPPPGSYGFIARVVFSPDGNRLAANGWDGKVTIWTVPPQESVSPQRP